MSFHTRKRLGGSQVLGGSRTFNEPGVWVSPIRTTSVNLSGRGSDGNAGNSGTAGSGNPGNSGNPGGGGGGSGGFTQPGLRNPLRPEPGSAGEGPVSIRGNGGVPSPSGAGILPAVDGNPGNAGGAGGEMMVVQELVVMVVMEEAAVDMHSTPEDSSDLAVNSLLPKEATGGTQEVM